MQRKVLICVCQMIMCAGVLMVTAGLGCCQDIETNKPEDRVTVSAEGETVIYTIVSPSGIGGATIPLDPGRTKRVVLRLMLGGLEGLTVTSGKVSWRLSVISHSGHPTLISLKLEGHEETLIEKGSLYWTEVKVFDVLGNPVQGLPHQGGGFELELPGELFKNQTQPIHISWIDFYRG